MISRDLLGSGKNNVILECSVYARVYAPRRRRLFCDYTPGREIVRNEVLILQDVVMSAEARAQQGLGDEAAGAGVSPTLAPQEAQSHSQRCH